MHRVFLPLLTVLGFAACQAPQKVSDAAPAKIIQWSGQYGGPVTSGHRVLRDLGAWNAFWQEVGREPPHRFDPARELAVVVYLGERRTGGFAAEIVAASPQDGNYVVTYRETAPPPGGMVTQASSTPWTVALVPRTDLPLQVRADSAAAIPRPSPAQK